MIRILWQIGAGIVSYLGAVLGETDYAHYVAHRRRHHPDADIASVGQYWRERYAEQEASPTSRCC